MPAATTAGPVRVCACGAEGLSECVGVMKVYSSVIRWAHLASAAAAVGVVDGAVDARLKQAATASHLSRMLPK